MAVMDGSGANLGFEDKLWAVADKLRGDMDATECKHADPEDKDEYLADNIFWVLPEARWSYVQKNAKCPEISTLAGDAMAAIEHDNPCWKHAVPPFGNAAVSLGVPAGVMYRENMGRIEKHNA
ncbi:MAG: hypothetical protein ABFE13_18185 [Phycisphaerales bacterium]